MALWKPTTVIDSGNQHEICSHTGEHSSYHDEDNEVDRGSPVKPSRGLWQALVLPPENATKRDFTLFFLFRALLLIVLFGASVGIGYATTSNTAANEESLSPTTAISSSDNEESNAYDPNPDLTNPTTLPSICSELDCDGTLNCLDACKNGSDQYNTCVSHCQWELDYEYECEQECYTHDCNRVCQDYKSCYTVGSFSRDNCAMIYEFDGCIESTDFCKRSGGQIKQPAWILIISLSVGVAIRAH